MARPARFTDRDLLEAATQVAAAGGPGAATIGAIAKQVFSDDAPRQPPRAPRTVPVSEPRPPATDPAARTGPENA